MPPSSLGQILSSASRCCGVADPTPEEVVHQAVAHLFSAAEAIMLLYAADTIDIDVVKMANAATKIDRGIELGRLCRAMVGINKTPGGLMRVTFMGWTSE